MYARPAYQNAAVTAYLSQPVTFPPSSYYKSGNRATPDVAIYASSFPIVVGGSFGQVGGTSLASPLWGGVVTLINEIAVKYTGKPVGFVNALLYTMYASDPTTFNDITSGNNANCPNATCVDTCVGFYTAPGYDAVTGLGSPNWSLQRSPIAERTFAVLSIPLSWMAVSSAASVVLCVTGRACRSG